MAKALTILVVLALTAAGYLIVINYDSTYKILPKVEHDESSGAKVEAADANEWRSFNSEDGIFTVLLPSLPQRAEDTISDPTTGEQRRYDMYVAKKNNGSIFMISMITYPSSGDHASDQKMLENVKGEMVAAHPGNQLLSSKTSAFLGHDAVDFSIENPDAHIDGKAFLVDSTLYLLTHVASKDAYDQSEFERFVNSFHLTSRK